MSLPLLVVADGALPDLDDRARRYRNEARFTSGDISTPEALARTAADADALIVTLHKLTADHISALPDSVRTIGRAGVGLDTIDLDAAARRGISIVFQPDYATNEVADHALAMLLATARRIPQADRRVRQDGWVSARDLGPVPDLTAVTASVLGTGRIGRAVIDRLRPFVRGIVGYDVAGAPACPGVDIIADLTAVLESCSVLTLHLPLNPQTRNLIGAAELALLAPGSILVNVSRGGLVDEAALAEALHSGHLGAAALDVFLDEPLPDDSPLRDAPNLVLTPHIAWYSTPSGERLADWTVSDVVTVTAGGVPEHGRIAGAQLVASTVVGAA